MDFLILNSIVNTCTDLFHSMLPLISAYMINNSYLLYKLDQDSKPIDIRNVRFPISQKQKYTDINFKRIDSAEIREIILDFSIALLKEFPEEALINFYNNINEVNIKKDYFISLFAASGMYNGKENRIKYTQITSIYHELFHMASSLYDSENGILYSGFRQLNNISNPSHERVSIGHGINEGYTELLAHRYFDKDKKMPWAYNFESRVMYFLENIIDYKELERLYLSANLMGLIEALKKYTSEEEILDFIKTVDLINEYSVEMMLFKNPIIEKSVKKVFRFLLKTYMLKQLELYEIGEINEQEYRDNINSYYYKIGNSMIVSGHSYEYFDRNILQEIYNEVIHTSNNPEKIKYKTKTIMI